MQSMKPNTIKIPEITNDIIFKMRAEALRITADFPEYGILLPFDDCEELRDEFGIDNFKKIEGE